MHQFEQLWFVWCVSDALLGQIFVSNQFVWQHFFLCLWFGQKELNRCILECITNIVTTLKLFPTRIRFANIMMHTHRPGILQFLKTTSLISIEEQVYKFSISPWCESSCGSSSLLPSCILFHTNHSGVTCCHCELAGVSLSCKTVWKIAHTSGTGMVFDHCEHVGAI